MWLFNDLDIDARSVQLHNLLSNHHLTRGNLGRLPASRDSAAAKPAVIGPVGGESGACPTTACRDTDSLYIKTGAISMPAIRPQIVRNATDAGRNADAEAPRRDVGAGRRKHRLILPAGEAFHSRHVGIREVDVIALV